MIEHKCYQYNEMLYIEGSWHLFQLNDRLSAANY